MHGCFSHAFHFPVPLGSTVVTRFIATIGTLTPALLVLAQNRSPWFTHSNFRTSRLQSPHAPLTPAMLWLRAGLADDSLESRSSPVLRTSLTICSLISRIRPNRVCVVVCLHTTFLRTIHSLPVALHEASLARSYFQLLAFSSAKEGLPPSCACSLSSALFRSSGATQ